MFIDRRFGEYDEKMTLEDKMMKRFTMEKKVWLIETFAWNTLNLHTMFDNMLIFQKLSYGTFFLFLRSELASQVWKHVEGKWNFKISLKNPGSH